MSASFHWSGSCTELGLKYGSMSFADSFELKTMPIYFHPLQKWIAVLCSRYSPLSVKWVPAVEWMQSTTELRPKIWIYVLRWWTVQWLHWRLGWKWCPVLQTQAIHMSITYTHLTYTIFLWLHWLYAMYDTLREAAKIRQSVSIRLVFQLDLQWLNISEWIWNYKNVKQEKGLR